MPTVVELDLTSWVVMLLFQVTIKASVLAFLGWITLRVLRVRNVILMQRVWALILVAMVAMPLLIHVAPTIRTPALRAPLLSQTASFSTVQVQDQAINSSQNSSRSVRRDHGQFTGTADGSTGLEGRELSGPLVAKSKALEISTAEDSEYSLSASAPQSLKWRYWAAGVVCVYTAGVVCMLTWLLVGIWKCLQLSRQSQTVELPSNCSVDSRTVVKESCEVAVPCTVGILHPVILLPADWREWDESLVEMAIIHESEHIHRGDSWLAILCSVNCAVHWFNPLSWRVRHRLTELAEKICDDRVIRETHQPLLYAERLVDMAARLTPNSSVYRALSFGMARAPLVEKRVLRIIDTSRELSRRPTFIARLITIGLVVVLTLFTAGLQNQSSNFAAEPTPQTQGNEQQQADDESTENIAGRVLMQDGTPVAAAEVRILTWAPKANRASTQTTRTNDLGEFEFTGLTLGKHRIAAYYRDFSSRTKRYSGGTDVKVGDSDIILELSKAPSLRVKVEDADGMPIKDARVRLTWTDTQRDHLTNANGVVTLRGLTAEVWTIEVQAKGYEEQVHAMNLVGSKVSEVTAALVPGREIFGTIRDPNGTPLKDVGISVFPGGMRGQQIEYMTTSDDGKYYFEYLPRSAVMLLVSKDNYQPKRLEVAVVKASEAGQPFDLELLLRNGGSVVGVVRDSKGLPIANAKVSNHGRSSRDAISTKTDDKGVFRIDNVFEGVNGNQLLIEAKDYAPQQVEFIPGSKEEPAKVLVSLEPGHRMAGIVVDEKGMKLSGVTISSNGSVGSGLWAHYSTKSDANGHFALESLPANAPLDFRKSGYSRIQDKVLPSGGREEIVVKMLAEGVLRGQAVDADTGTPLSRFVVSITFSPDRKATDPSGSISGPRAFDGEKFSNPEGVFEMRDLVQGMPLQVTVKADGYNSALVRRVIASADQEALPITFRLSKVDKSTLFAVAGKLKDAKSQPIVGVELRLIVAEKKRPIRRDAFPFNWQMIRTGQVGKSDGVLQFLEATSDENGEFAFEQVKPGADIELVYWGEGVSQTRKAGVELLDAAERKALALESVATGIVKGNLDGFGGVSDVMLSGNSDFFQGEWSLQTGKYNIKNVPPGSYQLQVYGPRIRRTDGSGYVDTEVVKRMPVVVKSGKTHVVDVLGDDAQVERKER